MKDYIPFLLLLGAFVSAMLFYLSSRKSPPKKIRKLPSKVQPKALAKANKPSIEELLKSKKKPEPSILGMVLRENIIRTTRKNPDQIADALRVWLKEEGAKSSTQVAKNTVKKNTPITSKTKKR